MNAIEFLESKHLLNEYLIQRKAEELLIDFEHAVMSEVLRLKNNTNCISIDILNRIMADEFTKMII